MDGRDLGKCECFIDLALTETKERVSHILEVRLAPTGPGGAMVGPASRVIEEAQASVPAEQVCWSRAAPTRCSLTQAATCPRAGGGARSWCMSLSFKTPLVSRTDHYLQHSG